MKHPFKVIYAIILPGLTTLTLLGVSSFIPRQMLIGIKVLDLFARIYLTVIFCILYVRLSRISEYSIYPNIKWSKSDVVDPFERFILIGVGIFFGIGMAVISWWTTRTFFLVTDGFGIVIAAINGAIIMVPVVANYWVLKM